MREKYKYLSKNTFVFAVSSFGTKFLSFLLVPLYTNVLTTSEYGITDIITTTATLMIYVCTVNIADGVLRFAIERKEKQSEILSFGIRVLIIGSLIAVLLLTIVSQIKLFNWPKVYLWFVFLYFFFTALYQIMTNFLSAVNKVFDVAVAGIISTVVMIIGNIIFLLLIKIGVYGYLISLVLGPFVGSIYCFIRAKIKPIDYIKCVCSITTQKDMLQYCVPLIFNNIALWINVFLDKYFVTAICGVGANGIYAVANKIPRILSTCYIVFSQAWTLSAIKEFDRDDKDGFFAGTYEMYNATIAVICSGVILLNVPLARILFAKDFFEAWKYSSILLLAIMFNALTSFQGSIVAAVKKNKELALTTLISAGCNILLNILLIPVWGALGAAIATAASYMVMWIIRHVLVRKYIKMKINLIKDCLVYSLLILQVILEHFEYHCYIGQGVILLIIIVLYRKYTIKILNQLKIKFLSKRQK